MRRLAHALVRGDAAMLDDPLRAQAVAYGTGCVLAAVAVAVCAVIAVVRPGAAPRDAPILMARETGALYVRIDDVVHPALNLSSARLVVGAPADPVVVDDSALAKLRRGPLVGIPGAPAHLGPPLRLDESVWAICDVRKSAETVLLAGQEIAPLPEGQALLVSARAPGAPTYLLADGRRARVDLRDIAVVRALHLEQVTAQPISQALLDSAPEVPALRAPSIPGAGTPGPAALGSLPVGTVIRVMRAGPAEYYVVLTDGLQRLGRVAADVIRFSVAQPDAEPPVVAADVVAAVPVADSLAVGRFPERVLPGARAVICARWNSRRSDPDTNTAVAVADSLPEGSVQLAQADGDGPNIDRSHIPAGRSVLLQATGVTGDDGAGGFTGPLYLLDDLGVLFGVRDGATAEVLGVGTTPIPAPWPMVAMLPRGPELNREAASLVRDSLSGLPAAPA